MLWCRANVASVKQLFEIMSTCAAFQGTTTRTARSRLYDISYEALTLWETGVAPIGNDAIEPINDVFEILGVSFPPDLLTALPADVS